MNLRERGITLKELAGLKAEEVEKLLKSVGFRRAKAERLVGLARAIERIGGLEGLKSKGPEYVRRFLRSIKGIGEETADAITLFALNLPTIPISKYVRTVLSRLGLEGSDEQLRKLIMEQLRSLRELKLFYAGVTSVGKVACKKEPKCGLCPLRGVCRFALTSVEGPQRRRELSPVENLS